MSKSVIERTYSILWYSFSLFFIFKMGQIISQYTTWEWDVDFLLTKQLIIHLDYYRWSFYVHIFSSLIVLVSGVFLFSNKLLTHFPKLHRWAGRTYVGLVLLASAPTALVMAFYANGGWGAKTSFIILAPLWWYFTWKGLQAARNRQFSKHKVWMVRSYAVSLSAVSLRIYQMFLGSFFMVDAVAQYVTVSWGSWIGNLLVVEIILAWPFLKNKWWGNMWGKSIPKIWQ